jgi:hypothetical protein
MIAALAVCSSCKKDDEEPPIKQHDTTYTFSKNDFSAFGSTIETSPIKKSVDSIEVRKIILKPVSSFSNFDVNGVNLVINSALRPAFALSPKAEQWARTYFPKRIINLVYDERG